MRIKVLSDGRVLQGTATDIVRQMQYLAFGKEQKPLSEYIDWLKTHLENQNGITLSVVGATPAERAESFLRALGAAGLVEFDPEPPKK